LLGNLGRQG